MPGLGQRRPARPRRVGGDGIRDGLVALEVPESDVVSRAAFRLLRDRKFAPLEVVAVHPYAITYKDQCGKVRTAWLLCERLPGGAERLQVWSEAGVPAFPSKPPLA